MEDSTKEGLKGCLIVTLVLIVPIAVFFWWLLNTSNNDSETKTEGFKPEIIEYNGGWEHYLTTPRTAPNYAITKDFILENLTDEKISAACSTPHVDTALKVYDAANLFSDNQYSELQLRIRKFMKATALDMAVVTTDTNPKKPREGDKYTPKNESWDEFAMDFYEYNDFGAGKTGEDGYDGLVIAIDMQNRAVCIYDFGKPNLWCNGVARAMQNRYLDHITPMITAQQYQAAILWLIDEYEKDYLYEISFPLWKSIIFTILISSFVGLIIALIKNKPPYTEPAGKHADEYIKEDSFTILNYEEQFLGTKTVPKKSTHHSSYSRKSSSGTHRTSSGRSAGGGSRRF